MFKLSLKGFEPLKDLEIESENGVFIVTGDDGLGVDRFVKYIGLIGQLLDNRKIGSLYGDIIPWQASPERLEFSLTHDMFYYHAVLTRKSADYHVDLEEIKNGKKTVFKHTRTTCNLRHKVDSDALAWKVVPNSIEKFPLLTQMEIRPFDYNQFSDFMWIPASPFYNERARDELRDKLFRSGTEYLKEIDNYLHWLTDDYSGLTHCTDSVTNQDYYRVYEHATKQNVLRNSTRLLGILSMLYCLLDHAKVLWHPETVINNQKIDAFYRVIHEIVTDRPVFIVTDVPEFRRTNTTIYLETRGDGIHCKKLQ